MFDGTTAFNQPNYAHWYEQWLNRTEPDYDSDDYDY